MMAVKRKCLVITAVVFLVVNPLLALAGTLSTSIELKNNTSSDKTLIDGTNTTGIVTPLFPSPALANSTTFHTSISNGLADAGVLTYQSCRFNWSVIALGAAYTFSIGAEPSSRCSSEVLVQNVFTGEYQIRFNIDG
ncbi:hypothetical protein [Microbulbifer spongiae]|uniref:Uncharacterized protein n=1 Tax=Microbulbifer spongiae TaxID=2944933 RepID=A0ABY9E884_9GAMM|nr:hypothetical protein [Microbulbifer sp. MI-G]WKD48536.1 hypothetical protein M8T91_11440 [Microbulbifer sp. MI-G]